MDFLKKKRDFVDLIIKHIGTSAIMDLLLRLLTCIEPPQPRQDVLNVSRIGTVVERGGDRRAGGRPGAWRWKVGWETGGKAEGRGEGCSETGRDSGSAGLRLRWHMPGAWGVSLSFAGRFSSGGGGRSGLRMCLKAGAVTRPE